jgi:SAM-dependent methyltransferase
VREPAPSEFDAYSGRYREAVQKAIGFAGVELDFFTSAKAGFLIELAARRVGEPGKLEFLDAGCGPGETDRFLEGRVARLAGADIAAEMIETARRRNPWAEYRHLRLGDPIPWPDSSFDVSFGVCVMHHVEPDEREAFVAEMVRVTRPGGIVAIFEHNPWNPLTRHAVANCEFDEHIEMLSRREVSGLLHAAGLTEIERSYIIFFTRKSPLLARLERGLRHLPLGAQHVVSGRRP